MLLFGKQFVAQWIRMEYIDTYVLEENQKNVVKRKNVARMIGKYREKKTMAKQQDVKKRTFDCELLLFFRHDRCADISTAKK